MTPPTTLGRYPDLPTVCTTLLAAINAHFAAAGVALPDSQFIAPGVYSEVSWDCEQLFVALQSVGWGVAEEAFQQTVQTGSNMSAMSQRHAVLIVELVRCEPGADGDGSAPEIADTNTAGLAFMKDCALLSQASIVAAAELNQANNLGRGEVVRAGIVEPIGPSGGYQGAALSVYVSLLGLNQV